MTTQNLTTYFPVDTDRLGRLHARLARRAQAGHPTGSLGIAISEAVEVAAQDPDCNYSLGSVLNHVLLHQTVIGQEAILQMQQAGEEPDVIVGCVGGGSNFAGLAFPFLRAGAECRIVASEIGRASCRERVSCCV